MMVFSHVAKMFAIILQYVSNRDGGRKSPQLQPPLFIFYIKVNKADLISWDIILFCNLSVKTFQWVRSNLKVGGIKIEMLRTWSLQVALCEQKITLIGVQENTVSSKQTVTLCVKMNMANMILWHIKGKGCTMERRHIPMKYIVYHKWTKQLSIRQAV